MRLCKYLAAGDSNPRVGLLDDSRVVRLEVARLSDLLHSDDPAGLTARLQDDSKHADSLNSVRLLAPIDDQEVWGAGVTYERSKKAREEESEQGGSFYDLVYRADRPEIFFKATPNRVVGEGESIRVRQDTNWCVPEPEFALVISPKMRLVGYTIGDDVSARDIEGQNPLYLPQAKMYDACCALGPVITLAESMPPIKQVEIRLTITRGGTTVVSGATSLSRMARTFEELIGWLSRDNVFPNGVILLTGTGIVPPDEFSLKPGDVVTMSVDGVGTLTNGVVQGY